MRSAATSPTDCRPSRRTTYRSAIARALNRDDGADGGTPERGRTRRARTGDGRCRDRGHLRHHVEQCPRHGDGHRHHPDAAHAPRRRSGGRPRRAVRRRADRWWRRPRHAGVTSTGRVESRPSSAESPSDDDGAVAVAHRPRRTAYGFTDGRRGAGDAHQRSSFRVGDRRVARSDRIGGGAGDQPRGGEVRDGMQGVADPHVERTRVAGDHDGHGVGHARAVAPARRRRPPPRRASRGGHPASDSDCARSGSSYMATSPRTSACIIRRARSRCPLSCSRVAGCRAMFPPHASLSATGRPTAHHFATTPRLPSGAPGRPRRADGCRSCRFAEHP